MEEDSKDRFFKLLEKAGIPLAAIVYCVTTAIQVHDALDKLGWRIASVLVLLASVAWSAHVWTAKRPNLLHPEHLQSRYGRKTRFVSLLAIAAACVPAWYVVAHPTPSVPALLIKVVNRTSIPAELLSYGDAYFSISANPISDTQIGSTRLELTPAGHGNALTVPAQGFIWVRAHFLNEPYAESFLKQEDVGLGLVLQTRDQRILQGQGFPFRKKVLTTKHVELDLEERKSP
jgi:hypothetical protein